MGSMRVQAWHSRGVNRVDRGRKLMALAGMFESIHGTRRYEAVQLYRMYKGLPVGGRGIRELDDLNPGNGRPIYETEVEQVLNIAKDLVDTAVSKLAIQDLKPQVVVTEGDWEIKRSARLVDRFIEGQMQEPQGKHKNAHAVFEHALRIALAATRSAAVKVYSDTDRGKVCLEIHDTLNMITDTSAAVYDDPSWIAEVQQWDPERLINHLGKEGEKYAREIWEAAVPLKHGMHGTGLECVDDEYAMTHAQDVYRVKVVEAWHYANGDEKGRHVIAINGATLIDEDYDYEDSPFIFVGGVRQLTGQWHQTLTKQVAPTILRTNEKLEDIEVTAALASKRRFYYDPEEHDPKALETACGEDAIMIPVTGLATGTRPPVEQLPQPFHPQMLDLVNFYMQHSYGLTGINQFNTAGQIAGDWSGVALRLMKDQLIERFASPQKDYIQGSVIELGKKIARCALEVLDASPDKKFKSVWRGEGMVKEVDAKVLRLLDEYDFTVDLYPVSGKKNSPEDRVQLFQDLAKSGLVSGDALLQVVQHYDTFGAAGADVGSAQRKNIEMQIDSWLYDDPEEMEDPEWYQGPVRSMNPSTALLQVNAAYLDALTSRVSRDRLEHFERFVEEALDRVREGNANMQNLAAAGVTPGPATPTTPGAGVAPAPAPPPQGAPPGAPMN